MLPIPRQVLTEGADPRRVGAEIALADARRGTHVDDRAAGGGSDTHHDVVDEAEEARGVGGFEAPVGLVDADDLPAQGLGRFTLPDRIASSGGTSSRIGPRSGYASFCSAIESGRPCG